MSEERSSTQTAGEPCPPTKHYKDDGGVRQDTQQKPSCIVHIPGLQYGPLQLLSATKDGDSKLARLKEVCKQRLSQPLGSIYRMTESCKLIPDVVFADVCNRHRHFRKQENDKTDGSMQDIYIYISSLQFTYFPRR